MAGASWAARGHVASDELRARPGSSEAYALRVVCEACGIAHRAPRRFGPSGAPQGLRTTFTHSSCFLLNIS